MLGLSQARQDEERARQQHAMNQMMNRPLAPHLDVRDFEEWKRLRNELKLMADHTTNAPRAAATKAVTPVNERYVATNPVLLLL